MKNKISKLSILGVLPFILSSCNSIAFPSDFGRFYLSSRTIDGENAYSNKGAYCYGEEQTFYSVFYNFEGKRAGAEKGNGKVFFEKNGKITDTANWKSTDTSQFEVEHSKYKDYKGKLYNRREISLMCTYEVEGKVYKDEYFVQTEDIYSIYLEEVEILNPIVETYFKNKTLYLIDEKDDVNQYPFTLISDGFLTIGDDLKADVSTLIKDVPESKKMIEMSFYCNRSYSVENSVKLEFKYLDNEFIGNVELDKTGKPINIKVNPLVKRDYKDYSFVLGFTHE